MSPLKTKKTTAPGPVERREALLREAFNLREKRVQLAARERSLVAEAEAADRERGAAITAAARQAEPPDTHEIDGRRRGLADDLADVRAQLGAVDSGAEKAIAGEVRSLVRERWEEFAAHAAEASAEAEAALDEMEGAYRRAYEAWGHARSAWARSVAELDQREDHAGSGATFNATTILRSRAVPPWPMAAPSEAFGPAAPQPRPPGFVDASRAAGQGKPGQYIDGEGTVHVLDAGSLEGHRYRVKVDTRGFALWRRLDDGES